MNWLTLVVENIGTTLAKDVRIEFEPSLTTTDKSSRLKGSVMLREGIAALPPGRRVETLFDLSHERLKQGLQMRYQVTVSFLDHRGRRQEPLPYTIDLTYLYDLEPLGERTVHDLVDEVKGLRREIEKWRGTERGLLVRRPTDVRRSVNESNWQYAFSGRHRSLRRTGRPRGGAFDGLRKSRSFGSRSWPGAIGPPRGGTDGRRRPRPPLRLISAPDGSQVHRCHPADRHHRGSRDPACPTIGQRNSAADR